ncbi:hypothetical protein D3C71_1886560 [compost metagenome]
MPDLSNTESSARPTVTVLPMRICLAINGGIRALASTRNAQGQSLCADRLPIPAYCCSSVKIQATSVSLATLVSSTNCRVR